MGPGPAKGSRSSRVSCCTTLDAGSQDTSIRFTDNTLRPGEPAVGSRARLVITAITTQGLSQAEAARTYGLSQAWVSRLMVGYRVEGGLPSNPLTKTQGRLTQGAAR